LNTIAANMRTEDLLKQSQSLTAELQSQQYELKTTNERLERQAAITGDANLAALVEEFAGYPAPAPRHGRASRSGADDILGPVRMRAPNGGEWAFFGMFATFDTPFEVTTSELAIELFFPADAGTAAAFRDHRAKGRYAPP